MDTQKSVELVTESLERCAESAGDITPAAQRELDRDQKEQDIVDNLPSWSQVETNINNISDLNDAKTVLLKIAKVTYWLARNSAT